MVLLQSPHWPFLIDVYFFLGGLAGGAFVFATAAQILNPRRYRDVVRVGYYLALAALIPCPLILIVDLGVPSRFLNMLMRFNVDSPMSMGSWALLGFSACAGLAALFTLLEDLRARNFTGAKRLVGVIGSAFGFFLAAYPGVLLGATARPLWIEGHALGALFLAVGASTGAAAMALILALMGRRAADQVASVRLMTVVALVIQLLAVVAFVGSVQASGSVAATSALRLLLTDGRFAMLFWGGAIVLGSVLPLILGLVDLRRRSFGLTAVTSLLVLVGGFLVKYVIMAAGQV